MGASVEEARLGGEHGDLSLHKLTLPGANINHSGDEVADLDVEQALAILANADFSSPLDRACFWARDGSTVPEPSSGARRSLNEVIANLFIQQENSKLLTAPERDGKPPRPYLTMHDLEAGRALSRVVHSYSDQPQKVHFDGKLLRNDSYAATDALIDVIASKFAQAASGIVTVSVSDAEPDTFFSLGKEMELLLENPAVTCIRALDLKDADVHSDVALERGEELARAGLGSSFFRRRELAIVQRVFTDKFRWEQWQKSRWLQTAIRAVRMHARGAADFQSFRFGGLAYETNLSSSEYCKARFQCELYATLDGIQALQRKETRDDLGNRRLLGAMSRLDQCAALVKDVPAVLSPLTSDKAADLLNRFHIKKTVADIQERDRLLNSYWSGSQVNQNAAAEVTGMLRRELDRNRRDG